MGVGQSTERGEYDPNQQQQQQQQQQQSAAAAASNHPRVDFGGIDTSMAGNNNSQSNSSGRLRGSMSTSFTGPGGSAAASAMNIGQSGAHNSPSWSPQVRLPVMAMSPSSFDARRGVSIPPSGARGAIRSHAIESPHVRSPLANAVADDERRRASSSPAAEANTIACLFRWDMGGSRVSVTGSFVDWKSEVPLVLAANGVTWSVTLSLPPGNYTYKFIVDGQWKHHPDQPTVHDVFGNVNNFVDVKEMSLRDLIREGRQSPPGEYGREVPQLPPSDPRMQPPKIPPHLLRALLNTAPDPDDPSLLPLPHHVMVNHLYVLPRAPHHANDATSSSMAAAGTGANQSADSLRIIGATQLYKGKYVTSVFYTIDKTENER